MRKYYYSRKGKIRDTLFLLLFYGSIIGISIFISRFDKLYFLVWLPILWSVYNLLNGMYGIWTTTFFLEEDKLIIRNPLNVTTVIYWKELKRVNLVRSKSKIIGIKIFSENKNLILNDAIENYEELFRQILVNIKKQGNIEIE